MCGYDPDAWQARTLALVGGEGLSRLSDSRVLVVGIGGVGGYTAEMLVRSGVGAVAILDSDRVAPSNINRQPVALHSTLGQSKVALAAARFADINPECEVQALDRYLGAADVPELLAPGFDFVADCIDTVAPKVALIKGCIDSHTRIISSMGAGGRLDPKQVQFSRLWETREDGLARAVRQAFKKQGLRPSIPVVYSPEKPKQSALVDAPGPNKRTSFGTLATVPAIFGIYMASHIINHILSHARSN